MVKDPKVKKRSLSWLRDKADKLFSEYIRRSNCLAGTDDALCFSCGCRKNWKEMQAGHFVKRNHLATRYLEQNCHVQCVRCNIFLSGNMAEYAKAMVERYGPGILNELSAQKNQPVLDTRGLYEETIEHMKIKIEILDGEYK